MGDEPASSTPLLPAIGPAEELLDANDDASEPLSLANFARSTCEIEKSTMKRTISSVIMSAYVISQRSWFSCSSCSSCFFRRAMSCRLVELGGVGGRAHEREELLLDDARVAAGLDREHAFEHELHVMGLHLGHALDLPGDRQPEDVGRHDAPEGRDEGAGDQRAQLVGLAQVLEHVHQTEDGADDAEGGGEAAHVLEQLRGGLAAL